MIKLKYDYFLKINMELNLESIIHKYIKYYVEKKCRNFIKKEG